MMKTTLTLYFIPSPLRYDWSTPTNMAKSVIRNVLTLRKRFMGHVNVELTYVEPETKEEIRYFTGMTSSNLDSKTQLFVHGIGLGTLLHSYPGTLEKSEDLDSEYKSYFREGNKVLNFVTYEISLEMALRVKKYLDDFKKYKLDSFYGLYNAPLHGEGSGCSAFGASFLELTGLLTEEQTKEWTRERKIPHRLIGKTIGNGYINFLKILLGKQLWAQEGEDHHEIFFWDPDLMYAWVEKKISEGSFSVEQKGNVTGIVIDAKETKVPTGPIFYNLNENQEPFSQAPDLSKTSNFWKYKNCPSR